MKTKVCSKCKLEKNICEFGNYKSSKDGLLYCCKKCNNDRSKKYREENYEKVLSVQRNWRREHPEWVKNRNKKNYIANKERNKERVSEWHKNNPEKRKIYRENYKQRKQEQRKLRRKTDEMFNIVNRLRCRIFKYLKQMNITKKNRTLDIVGCSQDFLREHLEKQFKDGMTWENKGKWHIDHIIPLSSANTEEELYKLCHYSNLQPLWAEENLKKGNKIL